MAETGTDEHTARRETSRRDGSGHHLHRSAAGGNRHRRLRLGAPDQAAGGHRSGNGTDIAPAAASDDVADALDYKAVSKRVQQFVGESSFFLVETLTERIAALVLDEFQVSWVRVRLNKVGALRGAAGVGIVIERGRRPDD